MKLSFVTGIAIALLGLCFAGQANETMYVLSGDMDVLQAGTNGGFGVGTGSGTGAIAGDYDDVWNLLNYTITWMDLTSTITNMHFHNAPVSESAGVTLGIAGPWSRPQAGSNVLNDLQETDFLAGDWYVNVHTANFGGGEIRGQVFAAPVPIPAAGWLLGSAIAGMRMMCRKSISRRSEPASAGSELCFRQNSDSTLPADVELKDLLNCRWGPREPVQGMPGCCIGRIRFRAAHIGALMLFRMFIRASSNADYGLRAIGAPRFVAQSAC
ncbi:MAG: hypothetical protein ACI9BW_003070 [Gammaproteobacteria bacterium]|jgi:hypothetical protein